MIRAIEIFGIDGAPASSISARFHLWQYAIDGIAKAPWIGHGFGSLEEVIERDLRPRVTLPSTEVYDHVHNTYLQTLWTHGIVGTALWALLGLALLRDAIRAARRDRRIAELMPVVWGVLGFTAVWAFFDYRISHADMRFFTILLLLSLRLLGRSHAAPIMGTRPEPLAEPQAAQ